MDVYQDIVKQIDRGDTFALAVIFRADGSTPQKAGAICGGAMIAVRRKGRDDASPGDGVPR